MWIFHDQPDDIFIESQCPRPSTSRRSCGNMAGVGLRVPCGGACEGRFGQVRVSRSIDRWRKNQPWKPWELSADGTWDGTMIHLGVEDTLIHHLEWHYDWNHPDKNHHLTHAEPLDVDVPFERLVCRRAIPGRRNTAETRGVWAAEKRALRDRSTWVRPELGEGANQFIS